MPKSKTTDVLLNCLKSNFQAVQISKIVGSGGKNHFVFSNCQGMIMTRDEFNRVGQLLESFFQANADREIIESNKAHWQELLDQEKERERAWRAQKLVRTPKPAYVYLIHSNGKYKIGFSNDTDRRLHQLQKFNACPVSLVARVWADNPVDIEADLHIRFDAKRRNGEWFDLSPDDVAQVIAEYAMEAAAERGVN